MYQPQQKLRPVSLILQRWSEIQSPFHFFPASSLPDLPLLTFPLHHVQLCTLYYFFYSSSYFSASLTCSSVPLSRSACSIIFYSVFFLLHFIRLIFRLSSFTSFPYLSASSPSSYFIISFSSPSIAGLFTLPFTSPANNLPFRFHPFPSSCVYS